MSDRLTSGIERGQFSQPGWLPVVIVVVVLVVGFSYQFVAVDEPSDEMDELCQDTFGEEYSSTHSIHYGDPPVIQCEGPETSHAYVEMPPEMAAEKGIKAGSYQNQTNDSD